MPNKSDTKKAKDKGKKTVRLAEDRPPSPPSTPALRPRHFRAAATPRPNPQAASKKKAKDAAPGSLSVHKALAIATPKAEKKTTKRGAKIEETSSDDETDEEPSSSELSGDEINDEAGKATEEFATVIRPGPPTVTDGEDAAEETDDDAKKKRKRSRKSPTPAPQKSARKEGQTAPIRKLSLDTSEAAGASTTAPATTSTAGTTSVPAMPEPVVPAPATTSTAGTTSAPAMPEPAVPAVATTPSLTIVAGASPLKKVAADGAAKVLLANAEKLQKSMGRYKELTDSGTGDLVLLSDEQQEKEDTKAKQKKKKSRKQKDKGENEKERSKQKSTESDIEMEESEETKLKTKPTKGKNRDAGSTKQDILAQIKKLQKLLDNQAQSDAESIESVSDNTSSENEDEDTKPTKKGKGHAKKEKERAKKGKKSTKTAADDPESFTYYKALSEDSRKVVKDLKARFTRSMFHTWWPEGTQRVDLGEEAYDEAVKAWQVTEISSGDEEQSSKSKKKAGPPPPFTYDKNVTTMVSNFPTEIRNGVRNTVVAAVESAYEIRRMPAEYSGTMVEYTCQAVADLVHDFSFAKDPDDSKAIVGSHPVIVKLVTKHFGKPEYMRDKEVVKLLSPMPEQCIAIVIAATRYALDRFAEGGPPKKLAFQEAPYKDTYFEALKLLFEAKKLNSAKHSELIELYRDNMPAIGANASKWRMAAEAFEADVKAEEEA